MEVVTCLSVFNLAHDATEREVHILFSGCPGYQRCAIIPSKNGYSPPFAFVQFDEPHSAEAAIQTRGGTTWNAGSQEVNIEMAKRNMPDQTGFHKGSKGGGKGKAELWEDPSAGKGAWGVVPPPAPAAWGPSWGPPAQAPPAKRPRQDEWLADGPCTLHVGGWPPSTQQDGLDKLLISRFGTKVAGSILKLGHGGGGPVAFVRFVAHSEAQTALHLLDGMVLGEGMQLKASFAKSELKLDSAQEVPVAGGAAPPGHVIGGGGGYGAWQANGYDYGKGDYGKGDYGKGDYGKGFGKAGGKPGGYNARVTLHFTGLPENIDEQSFLQVLGNVFGGDVVGAKLREDGSGRPPVAWVRFVDENAAANCESKGEIDLEGHAVTVGYARNELDVGKMTPLPM